MVIGFSDRTGLIRSITSKIFWRFCVEFWECVPGAGDMVYNWHMEYLADELQEIAERVFKNQPKEYDLICNQPPGTSKSTICSILYPCWIWARMPTARILTASHTDMLCLDFASKARDVMRSDKYRECFPEIQFAADQDAKGYYRNTLGGDRLTCTVAGKSPMGFHCHLCIVDDALDPKKAASEAELRTAQEFITQVIPSRKVNKEVSVTFLVMQRLHRQDPTAVMLETSKKEGAFPVRHIKLPAEVQDDPIPESLREKYVDGLLDPKRLNKRMLKEAYANLGEYGYSSQFRQSPSPKGGGMFKSRYFDQRITAAPYECKRIRAWDRAATLDGGCYTAGVLMAKDKDGNYYVEHVVHGQWEPVERNKQILSTAKRDRRKYGPKHEPTIYVEMEGGSSGIDSWREVARLLAGFNVRQDRPTGSKDVRAEPWSCQLAAGNVYLVEDGGWDLNGYVEEHLLFKPDPGIKRLGKWKDQVDASSMAFNLLTGIKSSGNTFRTYNLDSKKKGLRIVISTYEELEMLEISPNHSCLLVSFLDPGKEEMIPPLGFKLVDSKCLNFADLMPSEYQDKWETVLEPWGVSPSEVAMTREHGKALWAFLLKKREPNPDVFVFQDDGNGRALSAAYSVCDSLGLKRNSVIFEVARNDNNYEGKQSPNQHVFEVIKATRGSVL